MLHGADFARRGGRRVAMATILTAFAPGSSLPTRRRVPAPPRRPISPASARPVPPRCRSPFVTMRWPRSRRRGPTPAHRGPGERRRGAHGRRWIGRFGQRAEACDDRVLSTRDGAHRWLVVVVGGWCQTSTNHQPIVLQSDFNDERQDSQAIQRGNRGARA